MRVVLFFDQIQSGSGGKENASVPLAVEKGGIGAYFTFQQYLDKSVHVIATTYSGTDYFKENEAMVIEKMIGLLRKVKADIVLCGPCYNYTPYAEMAATLAHAVKEQLPECHPIVMCSQENEQVIETYKEHLTIVRMPKKGGVGLSDSFRNVSEIMKRIEAHQSLDDVRMYLYE